MAHYRTFYDERFVGSWDIEGKDATVTIAGVRSEKLRKQDGGDETKLAVTFKGSEKAFICNKTNAKILARLYGPDTDGWIGKQITLYAADVSAFGAVHRCIRVRDKAPVRAIAGGKTATAREPGED